MKLITYTYKGKEQVGVVTKDEKSVMPITKFASMNELVRKANADDLAEFCSHAEKCGRENADGQSTLLSLENVKIEAPIPVPMQDIICVGRNFTEHIKEGARFRLTDFDAKDNPSVYFSKRVNRAVANGDPINGHTELDSQLDYESELAVIIGKDAYNVKRENVADYIFGYTIINDVSARTLQNKHKQWYMGKSLDGFTPMGPWIVTADEFAFPPQMTIESHVNGELRQHTTTDNMIYDISDIICELTEGMTLQAGTIISTGTPAGVGMGMVPPTFMKVGDVVECTVTGIGTLSNPIA